MLLLLHGDNHVLSRQALTTEVNRLKNQGQTDVVRLPGKKLSLEDIIEACESGSLFGTGRLVVIEDLHAHPSKTVLSNCLVYLSKLPATFNLLLYSAKPLTAIQLSKLDNFTPRAFKTSSLTFQFIDHLLPGKQAEFFPLLNEAIRHDTAELVFFMLARQIRLLLQVTDPGIRMPPWQASRLKAQYQKFGEPVLVKLHDQFTTLDWHLKSGQTALDLTGEVQLILSTI